MTLQRLADLTYSQLEEILRGLGEPGYRAGLILGWVYRRAAASFEGMSDLPQSLRQRLAKELVLFSLVPIDERVSSNGQTVKTLFRLGDGGTIESVLMRSGRAGSGRSTVCVSTQVGCAIGCPFCATGQQGFERNLSAGEIIEQVLYFLRWLRSGSHHAETVPDDARHAITNVVFMGMGEPLANYEATWQCVEMLNSNHGLGLGARQITISTAGLVPRMRRLARESIPVELAVSLHAATNDLRNKLVPLNRRYPLEVLIPACREYLDRTGRRPTFEYVLFRGANDGLEHARDLAELLRGLNCHVNLIAGNPTTNRAYVPPSRSQMLAFQRLLTAGGISNTLRLPRGTDIEAGCGQLRSRWASGSSRIPQA